ncbi:MAG: indolepyruvate ferredoxin oxidoreductase subunit alpha [Rhodospirillaceae bacterium]|nr:indolepyruvate ferredoxin oxidoreductase subunit alpha [Rhodospirillaceae bacterium]
MGNEALARGAWEAGVRVAAAYPGTPSTEILESVSTFPKEDIVAQWSTNEKVALDVAMGASFEGVRSLSVMKHVGLNVASDALMSMTYIGVNGGLVIIVCDDPGIHSSQNEQDTRLFARFAMVPVLEPSDAEEALSYMSAAYDLSEKFDTPVIVRSTTRLSHTRSPVTLGERTEVARRDFDDNPQKNVMIPSHARIRHSTLIEREKNIAEYLETNELTRWEKADTSVGVITSSISYGYVKEVLPNASVLKLGGSYPLPEKKIRDFADSVDRVIIVEELEPAIENQLKIWNIKAQGKEFFSRMGELSPELVRDGFIKAGALPAEAGIADVVEIEPVPRPPVLCAGCPHTSSYMVLRQVEARVAGDIGCYTLAAVEPLRAIDTCVSMGSSIANAVGMAKSGVEEKPIVATIGDSTFLHAGIPPLIDAVYNEANITVMLLDNHTVAMTGGQDHAGTGKTLRGDETHRLNFEDVCRAVGVKWVQTVDSYDLGAMYKTLREAIDFKGVSVLISDRPCVLDPVKIKGPALAVIADNCTACQSCMNVGCPSISWSDEWFDGRHKVKIDTSTCVGCALCPQVCPSDAIQPLNRS